MSELSDIVKRANLYLLIIKSQIYIYVMNIK